MPCGHSFPAYEAVEVVDEKNNKTNYDGNIGNIAQCGKNPEDNQHNIVCGIGKGIICTAPESKIDGNEACCNRNGARNYICGAEIFKNEIENGGNGGGENEHKDYFFSADFIYSDFRFFAFIGISQPRYEGEYRHRARHSQIGYHFAVIVECVGNDSVKDAENYHQCLGNRVALCGKNQGGYADKGCGKGEVT